jgi:hypothetical protein
VNEWILTFLVWTRQTNYHLKSWASQWLPSKLIFTLLKYGTLGNTNCSSYRRPTTYSLWRLWVALLPSSRWVFKILISLFFTTGTHTIEHYNCLLLELTWVFVVGKMVNLTILHHWHTYRWTLQLFITRIDLGLCCRSQSFSASKLAGFFCFLSSLSETF